MTTASKNPVPLYLIMGMLLTLVLTSLPSLADELPDLWGDPAAEPAAALKVPDKATKTGTFEYIPLSPIFFNIDQATLTVEGQQSLDAAVEYLLKQDNLKRILIEGNADETGPYKHNYGLSDRRAEVVRNYLLLKGLDPTLLATIGKGEQDPVDQNWTRDGRRRNRHATIYAIQWVDE